MATDTKTAAEQAAADIMARVEALSGELSDAQKEQSRAIALDTIRQAGPELLADEWKSRTGYRIEREREGNAALDGTVWKRLGMSMSDVEFAHDILAASRGLTDKAPGPNEMTRKLVEAARNSRELDTAESGFGAQLVADAVYVPEIWETAREQYSRIGGLIESRPMGGPVEKQPVLAAVPDMIYVSEQTGTVASGTAYTTQKVGSNEVTLTAKKFLAHYNYSGEMVEDSIVPFVPLLRRAMAMAQGKLSDKLALNGDDTNSATGNINLDDADPADTLYYLAADGILHAAIVDNTANKTDHSGAALTYRALSKLPTLMLDRTYDTHWGRPADPNKVVFIGPPELDDDVLNLSEIVAAAAANGMIPGYTPLNGELTRIGKYPYISTIAMELAEADGKLSTTANNNTLGRIVCFNPDGLLWGVKRQASIEVERYARFDQWAIVMSTRVALGRYTPTGAASGIEWAACLYDIGNN